MIPFRHIFRLQFLYEFLTYRMDATPPPGDIRLSILLSNIPNLFF
jgi:hypothetical protein